MAELTAWETRHKGYLAASEFGRCLHCAAARLTGQQKTAPFSPAALKRMSLGSHFESMERERLKGLGVDFYDGRDVVLSDLPVPVLGRPDFVIRENGGYRIDETKFRSFPPPTLPREWGYQAGCYSIRYGDAPIDFPIYDLDADEPSILTAEGPPPDLIPLLKEWTEALRGVLDGKYQPKDLPHEPYWCRRSEWACPDCIGERQAETELSLGEQTRVDDFLRLKAQFDLLKQAEKELEASKDATKEILGARGGSIFHAGYRLTLRESKPRDLLDKKLIPAEVLKAATYKGKPSRTIVNEKEGDPVTALNNLLEGGKDDKRSD
ncbi:MAG TPA: hypothetical protein VNA25_30390 [Phycisphaerae bacterium]|nr:hypothetical protein [Phycisphaerae bacterium]